MHLDTTKKLVISACCDR